MMNLAYLAILAIVIEYGVLAGMVAIARSRYKVRAPAISGQPDFERYFRVQQNTLEQLVVVIPCLWIFAATLSPLWAAVLGFGFVLFRAQYAYGYYRSAPNRHYGFMWGAWCTGLLLVGALFGTCRNLWLAVVR
ncbi:MAG TPA: MAPEG family protein [Gammaproteobacteria bacterium]|nr:MAPEG family protein [Gammaproteobacteria bacterium]